MLDSLDQGREKAPKAPEPKAAGYNGRATGAESSRASREQRNFVNSYDPTILRTNSLQSSWSPGARHLPREFVAPGVDPPAFGFPDRRGTLPSNIHIRR